LRNPVPELREIWIRQQKRLFPKQELTPFLCVEQSTARALEKYHPTPYSGDAVVFRTYKDEYVGNIVWSVDEHNGWRDMILGNLDIEPVPGTHHSVVLNPEHACVLGSAMRRSFERAFQSSMTHER
jgi:thioesterase domain-containing protein